MIIKKIDLFVKISGRRFFQFKTKIFYNRYISGVKLKFRLRKIFNKKFNEFYFLFKLILDFNGTLGKNHAIGSNDFQITKKIKLLRMTSKSI